MTKTWALALAMGALMTTGVRGEAGDGIEGLRAGYVTGTVRASDGSAIAGAKFTVELLDEATMLPVVRTDDVDASGTYAIRIPQSGRYAVRAYASLPYAGSADRIPMEPANGALVTVDAAQGGLKDFVIDRSRLRP